MSTNDLTQRLNVRAVTDALNADEWIASGEIYARLPDPKLTNDALYALLIRMKSAGQLIRQGETRFKYRSGPNPVIDRRLRSAGPSIRAKRPGNCALVRMMEQDPQAFEHATRYDGPAWRRG